MRLAAQIRPEHVFAPITGFAGGQKVDGARLSVGSAVRPGFSSQSFLSPPPSIRSSAHRSVHLS